MKKEEKIYKIIGDNTNVSFSYDDIREKVDTSPKKLPLKERFAFASAFKFVLTGAMSLVVIVIAAIIFIPGTLQKNAPKYDGQAPEPGYEVMDEEVSYAQGVIEKKEDVSSLVGDKGDTGSSFEPKDNSNVSIVQVGEETYIVVDGTYIKTPMDTAVFTTSANTYTVLPLYSKDGKIYVVVDGEEVYIEDIIEEADNE